MAIQCFHPYLMLAGFSVLSFISYWRWYYYKRPVYLYSSLIPFDFLINKNYQWRKFVIFLLQLLSILSLILAISRFRIPDEKTKLPVQGVDIMLVLDVSHSMMCFDDFYDRRKRFEVALEEALEFIKKRENDPIGLVFFGTIAVSRCPLTLDKNMLLKILKETKIGFINPEATALSRAILTGINRLKESKAKSKIMIVLTDGEPTRGLDTDPRLAIDLAKKCNIKIYTVGIGSENGGFITDPNFGDVRVPTPLNVPLLKAFADQTGGQFFRVKKPDDMKRMYETIDILEKTDYETPLYAKYHEYFIYFLLIAFIALFIEIILSSFLWVGL